MCGHDFGPGNLPRPAALTEPEQPNDTQGEAEQINRFLRRLLISALVVLLITRSIESLDWAFVHCRPCHYGHLSLVDSVQFLGHSTMTSQVPPPE